MKKKTFISLLLILVLVFSSFPLGILATSKVIYYVSVSGDDSNSGLSEAEPLKTLSAVNKLEIPEGAKVLFKRGDIWRGEQLCCQSGVYYGAYGEGENPAFYGSLQNYAREEYWAATETANVWVSAFTLESDIGAIVFDNDSWVGVRYVTTDKITDLYKNGMFQYHDDSGLIYLYNNSGNPGIVYSEMEFIQSGKLIIGDGADNLTIEDITLKYGNYGYRVGGTQNNVVLRRLNIAYIGGQYLSNGSRGGNGIEFYGPCENILVEDCTITQCFDTAFTCQMNGGTNCYFKDVTLKNCDISYCHWTTEFWYKPYNSWDYGSIENLNIIGNNFSYSGLGFGTELRYMENDTNKSTFMTSLVYENYTTVDINITDNVFCGANHYNFYLDFGGYTPNFSNNKYILSDNTMPGFVGETLDTSCGSELTEMFFETDADIGYCNNITNSALTTAYNVMENSDFEADFSETAETDNNWYSENTVSFSDDKIFGERSLSLSGNTVNGKFTSKGSTPYKLGFWYKGNANVTVTDNNSNILSQTELSDTDWSYHKVYFTTPADCENIYVNLSGGSLYDRMMLTPYWNYKIFSFENGAVAVKDKNYTVGESIELIALPDNGYEIDGQPICVCTDGSGLDLVFDETSDKYYANAPSDGFKVICYFRKSGYDRGENLLSDSSFEAEEIIHTQYNPGNGCWAATDRSTVAITTDVYNSGNSSLMLKQWAQGVYQRINVEEGVLYEISFYAKLSGYPLTINGEYLNNAEANFESIKVTDSATEFKKFNYYFVAPVTDVLNINLAHNTSNGTAVYVDDISICKLTPQIQPTKYSITVSDNIVNGSITVNYTKSVAGNQIEITAIPDNGYALSESSLSVFTSEGNLEITSTDSENVYSFVMPAADVTVYAEFRYTNTPESGTVNLIKNSGIDNDGADWDILWSTKIYAATVYVGQGDKVGDSCFRMENYCGGFRQSVELKANVTYTLSYLIASNIDNSCPSTTTNVSVKAADGTVIYNEDIVSSSVAYETKTVSFVPTADCTATLRFMHDVSDRFVLIDDVSLTAEYSVSLESNEMFMDENCIFAICDDTSSNQVIDSFVYNNCELCFDGEGEIKTGDTFTLYVSDVAVWTRSAAVMGDCNSDGSVNLKDLVAMKKYCADICDFDLAQKYATRINDSEEGSAASLSSLRKLLINMN